MTKRATLLSVKFSKRSVRVCALRALKTARQTAEALRPLAGSAVGQATLNKKVHMARWLYGVIAVSVLVGLGLNYAGLNVAKMLFWSAVLNGILGTPFVVLVVLLRVIEK